MDLVTGAMGSLLPKLLQLLRDEYKLQKGVRAEVESLTQELKGMHVALCKVAQVRHDQLDEQVRLWASEVREASYDMEDILDAFLVRIDGGDRPAIADKGMFQRLRERMGKLLISLGKIKARHDIGSAIEGIKKQVEEMARRRDRYRVHDLITANPTATTSIDPRLSTLYTKASELIGIEEPRDALIKMLSQGVDDPLDKKMKIVSVVGSGGLGKTTLAKVVHDKIKVDMHLDYTAFVPVGQNPDFKKVFRDILLGLDKKHYTNKMNFDMLDEKHLIDEIQEFLKEKRYFIVIDDIWEVPAWNMIRIAMDDNNMGSKIMMTTRCTDVANQVTCSFKIKPLSPMSSTLLFYGRIFGSKDKCPQQLSELSENILKKCGGVPLVITTIASLLAKKPEDDIAGWQEVCNGIGFGLSDSHYMENMRKILSLSYFDLPSHLKTCFLYLSTYPEDYKITRDRLIWRWIAEGFIQPKKSGDDLFELGKSYFDDLIDRNLVQPECNIAYFDGEVYGCRVHDMIHDLICSLSRKENFVTTSYDIEQTVSSGSKVRRLSLKNTAWPKTGMSQVRSIAIFSPFICSMPSLSCFDVLRVLDLEGCRLEESGGRCMLNIGNLIHLRYLVLIGTKLRELPVGIEKLRFLQVLKPGGCHLPPSIFGLRRLMCLEGGWFYPTPGNLLGNLVSLQVLKSLPVDENSVGAVEELGHLTQLRELHLEIRLEMVQSLCDSLVDSLCNLRKLQKLHFKDTYRSRFIKWEKWAPSPHLRTLIMFMLDNTLLTLPKWINPISLPLLSVLHIEYIGNVHPDDIQILGRLPALCRLFLKAEPRNLIRRQPQKFVVGVDAFPCTKSCRFINVATVPSMFPQGAMPKVESLTLCLRASDFEISSNSGFNFDDLAMGHLPSLRNVHYDLYYQGYKGPQEVVEVEEALRLAAGAHPNHPSIKFDVNKLPS